uniref:Uncharacterized protein n=1 Tax=Opuntia streptacantha TaxID=393608 RepID=A0A7C9AQX6_OPUST
MIVVMEIRQGYRAKSFLLKIKAYYREHNSVPIATDPMYSSINKGTLSAVVIKIVGNILSPSPGIGFQAINHDLTLKRACLFMESLIDPNTLVVLREAVITETKLVVSLGVREW